MGSSFIYKPRANWPQVKKSATVKKNGFVTRKAQIQSAFLECGAQAAIDLGVQLGQRVPTIEKWIESWRRDLHGPMPRPRKKYPSLSLAEKRVVEAMYGRDIPDHIWDWVAESRQRLEQAVHVNGRMTAIEDAVACIAASAIFLVRVCGSRATFTPMQQLTDQLVTNSGELEQT